MSRTAASCFGSREWAPARSSSFSAEGSGIATVTLRRSITSRGKHRTLGPKKDENRTLTRAVSVGLTRQGDLVNAGQPAEAVRIDSAVPVEGPELLRHLG